MKTENEPRKNNVGRPKGSPNKAGRPKEARPPDKPAQIGEIYSVIIKKTTPRKVSNELQKFIEKCNKKQPTIPCNVSELIYAQKGLLKYEVWYDPNVAKERKRFEEAEEKKASKNVQKIFLQRIFNEKT